MNEPERRDECSSKEWDLEHPGPSFEELGIPARESHAYDPQRIPHRSRWRLGHHRGDHCLWARIRIPKARGPAPPERLNPEA